MRLLTLPSEVVVAFIVGLVGGAATHALLATVDPNRIVPVGLVCLALGTLTVLLLTIVPTLRRRLAPSGRRKLLLQTLLPLWVAFVAMVWGLPVSGHGGVHP